MNFSFQKILILSALFVVSGCISSYGLSYDAQRYHELGMTAERSGDYRLAQRYYEMALVDAKDGHGDLSGISMVTYNLGRVTGYLCDYDNAHKLLTEALVLEEKVTGPKSGITGMRLFELARLHYDQHQYKESLQYFDRGVPIARALGVGKTDPIAFANVLDEYANALEKTNHSEQAHDIRNVIVSLRAQNKDKPAKFIPVHYDQFCKNER